MKTVYYGGIIRTMEQETETVEAMLCENGKILAVGRADALCAEANQKIHLQGKTLLPAFLDAHSHFMQVANAALQVSLDGADSAEAIHDRIRNFLQKNAVPKGAWIQARDYDHTRFPDGKHPALAEIDRFAPEHPLVIHHKSGHMGLLNTCALQRLGITPQTPCPDGGKIEVQNGALTGYLEENAFFDILKRVPMPDTAQLLAGMRRAQEIYLSNGITTFQDGMAVEQMLPLYQMLLRENLLLGDLVVYPDAETYPRAKAELDGAGEHFSVGGIKMFLDGSPQGKTAWMRSPYENSGDYCGYGTMTDADAAALMRTAAEYRAQLLCHCNGDAAAAQYLRCLQEVEAEYPDFAKQRPVLIHGQLLGRDQLPLVKRLGVIVSFFIAHIYHWGDVHLKNFGMPRAAYISPAASAKAQGVPFTFHQDAPVIAPNMAETVWCAVNRKTESGVLLGEAEKLSVYDALCAVTKTAAYQYFQEHQKGSLCAGKQADFIICDADPLQMPPDALRNLQILATFKNEKCVYRKENSNETPA